MSDGKAFCQTIFLLFTIVGIFCCIAIHLGNGIAELSTLAVPWFLVIVHTVNHKTIPFHAAKSSPQCASNQNIPLSPVYLAPP
jgi:hypothetical protein